MSDPVAPFLVTYSIRVRQRLLSLADTAAERGDGEEFLAALKEFHRRLRIYPQFGDPLIDLKREKGQVWVGIVRPLSMRYSILDERRMVLVAEPPVLLRRGRD